MAYFWRVILGRLNFYPPWLSKDPSCILGIQLLPKLFFTNEYENTTKEYSQSWEFNPWENRGTDESKAQKKNKPQEVFHKWMKAATTVSSQYEEPNESIAVSSLKKMEDSLIILCFQWKEHIQHTNFALGKTWLMQLLLKKGQQQHWHFFYSGPPFKHLPLHFKYVHMHVLILKWDFSIIKHAKHLSLAVSVALVMLVNSHPYVPDRHNRKFSFPKPRNFSVVQTVAESSYLEDNQTDLRNRSDSQKSQCRTFQMMHCTVFNMTCSCRTSATRVGTVQNVSFLTPIPVKWCSHKQDLRKSVSKQESHSSSKRWELQTSGTAFLFSVQNPKNYFISLPTWLLMETNTSYAHATWQTVHDSEQGRLISSYLRIYPPRNIKQLSKQYSYYYTSILTGG